MSACDHLRVNKVNYRKEFFRIPLHRIREILKEKGLEVTFTMLAEAREYRESIALSKMTPEQQEKYAQREPDEELISGE